MLRQSARDLAGLVPVRRPGVKADIGKAILEEHAVETVGCYTPRGFLQRQAGINAGEDTQLQVLLRLGAQVRSSVADEGKADGGDARELQPLAAIQGVHAVVVDSGFSLLAARCEIGRASCR